MTGVGLEETRQRLQRLVFRPVAEFLVHQAARMIRRHHGNFIRGAVFLAIAQATRAVGPQSRAISVRAVAQSLGLPYETTRRKVQELVATGFCVQAGDQGVAVRPEVMASEEQRSIDRASWAGLVDVVSDLKGLGVDFASLGLSPTPVSRAASTDPGAAAGELIDGFLLRILESGVVPHGSMMNTLVYVALLNGNARAITYDPVLARRYAGRDTPPPDGIRRPVSIGEVARELSIPRETVRRRIQDFVGRGWVTALPEGYLTSMERMQNEAVLATGVMTVQRFMQLIQALRQLGFDLDAVPPREQAKSA